MLNGLGWIIITVLTKRSEVQILLSFYVTTLDMLRCQMLIQNLYDSKGKINESICKIKWLCTSVCIQSVIIVLKNG